VKWSGSRKDLTRQSEIEELGPPTSITRAQAANAPWCGNVQVGSPTTRTVPQDYRIQPLSHDRMPVSVDRGVADGQSSSFFTYRQFRSMISLAAPNDMSPA
jgi:hypothetical protein